MIDIDIVKVDSEWQVWTAGYPTGACIGSGITKSDAMRDAVSNMNCATAHLKQEAAAVVDKFTDKTP